MRIGVLSDSHDRVPAVAEFARRFAESGVELILHAGDYCSPFVLHPFRKMNLPLAGVLGRNDGDHEGLRAEAAKAVGTELYASPHSVEIGGRRLLLVHDIGEVMTRSLEGHDIVLHGCSHRADVSQQGSTTLVNPGESCGWLHGTPMAAILDLTTLEVETLSLDGAEWEWRP